MQIAAYYVVSEALTSAAKHADASAAHVAIDAHDGDLELSNRNTGRGGADARGGSVLVGLVGRVDTLGGRSRLRARSGRARLHVTLPFKAA